MKKFLSIVAVIALVFALTIPAFADEAKVSSPVADDLIIKITASNEKPSDAEIGAGNKLLGVWDAALVHESTGEEATAEEVAAYFAANGGSIVIDFSSVVTGTPVKVLHKVGGAWQSESFSGAKVTVSSLSPFAFVVKDGAASGGAAPGRQSPQTGSNAVLWAIGAAAMMLAAGYCLSRKKVAE